MEYKYLFQLAIILISTKAFGLIMRRIGMPQVVGALVAGILIGPILGLVEPSQVLTIIAEIGVLMIIFSAGIETDIKEIKNCGIASILVAIGGIVLPLALGFGVSELFNPGFDKATLLKNIFIGIILTATSISITVETLREMGKLNTRAGTVILSAAIIDDIIGIILLSLILGLNKPDINPGITIIKTICFFILSIGLGVILHILFKKLAKKYPRQRRIPIFALGVCLLYAFSAEHFFGVADITGAYIAGIIFSGISVSHYIEKKIDINSYMFFAPIFFAYIGIKASFAGFELSMIWFAIAFILAGIVGKALGCYVSARTFRMGRKESLLIGIGMIARGEVALVVMQKGVNAGIIESSFLAIVVSLVIITSLLAPILLRLFFKDEELNGAQLEAL